MEISGVSCRRYEGVHSGVDPDTFIESRVTRPLDAYAEFRAQDSFDTTIAFPEPTDDGIRVNQVFIEIETTTGMIGRIGPVTEQIARITTGYSDFLSGRDPVETEKLWDLLYRKEAHGRKGIQMMAISTVDCALWDLKGKVFGEPVYRLLGGPTRAEIPAYASMFMYDTRPEAVTEAATEMKDRGYFAQKWFFQHGPGSGTEGKQANIALAEAARDAVGPDYDLMFDCWMGWNRNYALDMISRLATVDPTWLEEPVPPDHIDFYAELQAASPFPIAGGEHEYTRWGAAEILSKSAVGYFQPDTMWAGGISELDKIFSLGSVHGIPIIPHGTCVPANIHVSAAQPPDVCPYAEYLVKLNEINQFFFENPITPVDGEIHLPDSPGLGTTIDSRRVTSEETDPL